MVRAEGTNTSLTIAMFVAVPAIPAARQLS